LKAWECRGTSTINTEFTEKLNKVNSIEGFYAGTGIFMTGTSGFLGKGLLEKLMRVFPRVAFIFILIRPKKTKQWNNDIKS
jgi:alcohol-forming fatty acyl-CoA reductase